MLTHPREVSLLCDFCPSARQLVAEPVEALLRASLRLRSGQAFRRSLTVSPLPFAKCSWYSLPQEHGLFAVCWLVSRQCRMMFIGCSGHQLTPEGTRTNQAYNLSDVTDCEKIGESTAAVAENLRWEARFIGGLGGSQSRKDLNPKREMT
ncbi:hypothetical protein WDW89_15690 [Deltaproteobacteria bacterium TL4]